MKKKIVLGVLLVTLLIWTFTSQNPFQLLVSFIAAGALPGIRLSLSPYLMFGLAAVGGCLLLIRLTALEIRFGEPATTQPETKNLKMSRGRDPLKKRRRYTQLAPGK